MGADRPADRKEIQRQCRREARLTAGSSRASRSRALPAKDSGADEHPHHNCLLGPMGRPCLLSRKGPRGSRQEFALPSRMTESKFSENA